MDKDILVQYCALQVEIKDIRERIDDYERRIKKAEKKIDTLHIVSDSVKGTRPDGTYGSIRITGYPTPEYYRLKELLEKTKDELEKCEFQLAAKELEFLKATNQAEEFIEGIKKSELRTMFRLYYIDGLNWIQVAHRMNWMFPNRQIKYTADNCQKKNERFFENVVSCRENI